MNKTLLLIIIDFLFLNLIALTRWEKVEPARAEAQPVAATMSNIPTAQQDLVVAMRQQLADESGLRAALEARLARADTNLTARQQNLSAVEAERAALQAQLAEAQRNASDLNRVAQAATAESNLTQQQLEQLQQELAERRAENQRQQRQLAQLQDAAAAAHKQIQGLTMAVVVDEAQKQQLQKQANELQQQVQVEETQRAQLQASAEKLAQGVGELAQNSGELTQEIREDRPINENVLYSDFLANRVRTTFTASRRGLFGSVNRSRQTPTVFVTDGRQVYALLDIADTVFSLDQPNLDWTSLGVTFDGPASYTSPASQLDFLEADPRVVAVPVDRAQVAALGVKVYTLARNPFKFPDAVLIRAGKGYGELQFKLDPTEPGYVRVDNQFFRRLLGDFSPSRGDLVLSHTGEVLGMMVNRNYCVLLKDFTPLLSLSTGAQTGAIAAELDGIAAHVQAMPAALQ